MSLRYFDNYWNYLLGKTSYGDYLKSEDITYKQVISNIDSSYIEKYKGTNLIPLYIDNYKIFLGYLEDIPYTQLDKENEELVRLSTYDYKNLFNEYYGKSEYFKEIPLVKYTQELVKYAIEVNASDISTYYEDDYIKIFFAVPPTNEHPTGKLHCPIKLHKDRQTDFIRLMTGIDIASKSHDMPIWTIHQLDSTHNGRCIIQFAEPDEAVITIRIAENGTFNLTLDKLNLSKDVYNFLNDEFAGDEGGLRLVIGRPGTGKNTTILSVLKNYVAADRYKIVEIGRIERKLKGIIQLNCRSDEQLKQVCESVIDIRPDIIYFDEISDTTAPYIISTCNKGIRVITTVHSNSNTDVLLRIKDITGKPYNEIIQILRATLYQTLVPANNRYEPRCRYIKYTEELKLQLYDKPLGEIVRKLREVECGDSELHTKFIAEE